MRYLFGDTELAIQRLHLLANVFAESSKPFLQESNVGPISLALDLGCGPGFSTHFLAEVLQCHHVAGLDNSAQFISHARKKVSGKVSFYHHDVTLVPFPLGPCDLLYCRFLLTHLKDPHETIAKWASQLRPKGRLLMDEVEWIETKHTTLASYLSILQTMLVQQGNQLYIGPQLNSMKEPETLERRTNEVRHLKVPTAHAAAMFFYNIRTWKDDLFIKANYTPAAIQQLQSDLNDLRRQSGDESEISWGMRQVVFERV